MSWEKVLLEKGKCCICEDSLKNSKHINLANMDKYAEWKFPSWGNILAKDPEKQGGRAVAILCDNCVNAETGRVKGEAKYAIEVITYDTTGPGKVFEIKYHKVEDLKDAPEIKLEDLRI